MLIAIHTPSTGIIKRKIMFNQQRDHNGSGEGRRIPFHIGGDQNMRWPSQSNFIADDNSWMDTLFRFEGNIFERTNDLVTEFGAKRHTRNGNSGDEKHRGEEWGKRQGPHLTDIERRHQSGETNVVRDRRNPPPTADGGTKNDKVPFRTQYVNLMFSSFSIRGWGHDASSYLPCHYMHLIKEPT